MDRTTQPDIPFDGVVQSSGLCADVSDLSLLEQLRRATADCHRQIEQNGRLASLLTPQLTRQQYLVVLGKLYGFYRPLEARLLQTAGDTVTALELEARCKSSWLVEDLLYLGSSEQEIQTLPASPYLPAVPSSAAALGCLYVLEGATLGGRIISRQLADNLGMNAEQGGRFYFGYGVDSGRRWAEFRRFTETCCLSDGEVQEVLTAAKDSFDCLNQWLSD